jgi:hypothetical protein
MIPKIWISDESPPRVLFAKGYSSIDPDCIVAFPENDPAHSVWIVYDGDREFKASDYFVCAKGKSFRARPVRDPAALSSNEGHKP